jgi:hypothetical protein
MHFVFDLSCVMDPEFFAVNITCSFNYCHFSTFLANIEFKSCDLPYSAVLWLNHGKILWRFFAFQNEIDTFLHEKSRLLAVITNSEGPWTFVFLAYLTQRVHDSSTRVQRETGLIYWVSSFPKYICHTMGHLLPHSDHSHIIIFAFYMPFSNLWTREVPVCVASTKVLLVT